MRLRKSTTVEEISDTDWERVVDRLTLFIKDKAPNRVGIFLHNPTLNDRREAREIVALVREELGR